MASVSFSEGLTSIRQEAFYGATSLASVSFPESLTSIGRGAFYNATSLASVSFQEGLTSIGTRAFHNTLLTEADVALPASLVGEMKRQWYNYNCIGYTDLVLPEGLITIEYNAFKDCHSLLSVTLPSSLTSIGEGAFWGATALASVTLTQTKTATPKPKPNANSGQVK